MPDFPELSPQEQRQLLQELAQARQTISHLAATLERLTREDEDAVDGPSAPGYLSQRG